MRTAWLLAAWCPAASPPPGSLRDPALEDARGVRQLEAQELDAEEELGAEHAHEELGAEHAHEELDAEEELGAEHAHEELGAEHAHELGAEHAHEEPGLGEGWKAAFAAVLFAETLGACLLPLARRSGPSWALGSGFAGGTFAAAGLGHLFPHALEAERAVVEGYPLAATLAMLTFYALLALHQLVPEAPVSAPCEPREPCEHTGVVAAPPCTPCDTCETKEGAPCGPVTVAVAAVSAHAFLAGAAVGFAPPAAAGAVFLAIAVHKGPEALSVGIKLAGLGAPLRRTLLWVVAFSLVSPAGVLFGLAVPRVYPWVALVVDATCAGTFLFMGLAEPLADFTGPRAERLRLLGATLAGAALFFCCNAALALADVSEEHDH